MYRNMGAHPPMGNVTKGHYQPDIKVYTPYTPSKKHGPDKHRANLRSSQLFAESMREQRFCRKGKLRHMKWHYPRFGRYSWKYSIRIGN